MNDSLKTKTARTLKWNTIDRFSTQILYAITGIVLANVLSKEDFGLVGALLVFQAFALIFVDSGFGAALLRTKDPTEEDYSTVFWFNLFVSLAIYLLLYLCAPMIAGIFHSSRLIPLSKVMFFTFVLNGLGIVQTNRLVKEMNVKQVAVSNLVGLTVSGIIGIWLALDGFGPWALVWQSVTLAAVRTGWLWVVCRWIPKGGFHLTSLSKIWRIGLSVLSTSVLNNISQYIYSFIIGAYYNLVSLGIYTQADKWSKMGSAAISQVLTSSFVPLLSRVQDNAAEFRRYMKKINRFTAFMVFPALGGLAVVGTPLFHTLFGTKWDAAVPLFQLLCVRGIFVVLTSLCTNYLLALGYGRRMITVEIIKDLLVFAAIAATISLRSVEILVWGQLAAAILTWAVVTTIISRVTDYRLRDFIADFLPFLLSTLFLCSICLALLILPLHPVLLLLLQILAGIGLYLLLMKIMRIPELSEIRRFLPR